MAIDIAKWPPKHMIRILEDISWILDQLTEDMKLAREWGNRQELSEMIDLGIAIGWDLDEIFSQTIGKPATSPRLSGAQEPTSFEECLKIMDDKVLAFQSKMNQHLEALKEASREQRLQENFMMRRLKEGLALSLRNIREKCQRSWPGRWHEATDERFEVFMRLKPEE